MGKKNPSDKTKKYKESLENHTNYEKFQWLKERLEKKAGDNDEEENISNKTSKKKKTVEPTSDDIRILFGYLKATLNLSDTLKKTKKDEKIKELINLMAEKKEVENEFNKLLTKTRTLKIAYDHRVRHKPPQWTNGESVILMAKVDDCDINIGTGIIQGPVLDDGNVDIRISFLQSFANEFTNRNFVQGEETQYPSNLLSLDKSLPGVTANSQLLSNPAPTRKSIVPTNNMSILFSEGLESQSDTLDVESNTNLTPNASSIAIQDSNIGMQSSTGTDDFSINTHDSTTLSTKSTRSNEIEYAIVGSLDDLDNIGKWKEQKAIISTTDLGNLYNMARDARIDQDYIVVKNLFASDFLLPSTDKSYAMISISELRQLCDNKRIVAQENRERDQNIQQTNRLIENVISSLQKRPKIQLSTDNTVSDIPITISFGETTVEVSLQEYEKVKRVKINEAIDMLIEWFSLQETQLKEKEKDLKNCLFSIGNPLSDSTLKNRPAYLSRKREGIHDDENKNPKRTKDNE